MTSDDSLTARLAPVTLVVGKGGVGKTTVAAALAREFARMGSRTLVVTTDPAATLLAAFGKPVALTTHPVVLEPTNLSVWAIDTHRIRDEFLERWREPITQILDRGTYLDVDDVAGLVDATLPGADEIFALLALGEVLQRTGAAAYERVVVDTAPTGHTLRLLDLPRSFDAVVRLLDAMQEKHRFMVRALTRRYRADAADAFITDLRERVNALQRILGDPKQSAAVLVTRPEPVVVAESVRYLDALKTPQIAVAAILVNTWRDTEAERAAIAPLQRSADAPPLYAAPQLESGILEAILASIQPLSPSKTTKRKPINSSRSPRTSAQPERSEGDSEYSVIKGTNEINGIQMSLARPITIVAGKGGVGKTTVSCAIAIACADTRERTLLVSTDPAPSIADALGQPVSDTEVDVAGVAGLHARQMDATAAFAALRTQYEVRIDEVFESLTGPGVNLVHDRQILRDLLALAPPGIDELYALTVLGDALEEGRFSRIIVDPAPTGHLLRLLDMPALAVAWSHQLMRLMLKYKEIVGLGEAAKDLLTFAKRTRALEQRFRDPDQAAAVLVSLDEPLVRGETGRLLTELRGRGIAVGGIVWNRAAGSTSPLPTAGALPQYFAPLASPAPVGVEAIRKWSRAWRGLVDG